MIILEGKYILTHDLGTSGNKAVLFDSNLDVISQIKINYPLYYPKPGWAEQNAEDYWDAVKKATNVLVHQMNINPDEIRALTFDSQMNCTVPIDSKGNPLMNCINWLDTRAAPLTRKFSKGIIKISGYGLKNILMFLKITGGAPGFNGKDPISHILWIKENKPEKLIYWKRNVYDVIPFGDKRRQVILASLFYLLGKYPKSNIGEYTYIFNSVIDCEFMLYKCLGLSHQEGYSFPFRDYFRISISEEAKKDELVTNDLFEEITGFKMRKAELESPEVCEIKA